MTPEQFCYWLQGRAELVKQPPNEEEWKSIVEHLGLVFTKVTSPAPGSLLRDNNMIPKYDPTKPEIYC